MRRMSRDQLLEWYDIGVRHAVAMLRAIKNICNNKETIICLADHGELLKDDSNQELVGHVPGMLQYESIATVPVWINKLESIPENISHQKLKDWIIEMYKKYELENEEYQKWKKKN